MNTENTLVSEAYEAFKRDVEAAVPGRILLTKVWGSHSHNTAIPESDIDFLAVYQAPLREILRMEPPSDTITHTGPDWQAHELGKFCALLLKGNPAMVECLFTEHWYDQSPAPDRPSAGVSSAMAKARLASNVRPAPRARWTPSVLCRMESVMTCGSQLRSGK